MRGRIIIIGIIIIITSTIGRTEIDLINLIDLIDLNKRIEIINVREVRAQESGQGVDAGKLAVCLRDKNWVMYGKDECGACAIERGYFGDSFKNIVYVNCTAEKEKCTSKNIRSYPTWEDATGRQYKGAIPLDKLAELSGCQEKGTTDDSSTTSTIGDKSTTGNQITTSITGIINNLGKNAEKYLAVFLAGLISFLAPCLLPLFPTYFGIITGYTFADLYGLNFEKIRGRVILSALFFVAGFTLIFTLLGATGSIIGQLINNYLPILLKMSGILLIFLGLVQIGRIKIPMLEFDYAWAVQKRLTRLGYASSFTAGIASALCWIPCIGPVLASVLLLAGSSQTIIEGSSFLFVYSLGITLPFILGGLFFPKVVDILKNNRKVFHYLSILGGLIMIAFGFVLILDKYKEYIELYYAILRKYSIKLPNVVRE